MLLDQSLRDRARALMRSATDALVLREVARVGRGTVLEGRPRLLASHGGRITLGDRFRLSSRPAMSHIVAEGGEVVIGDDVCVGCGAAIFAASRIRLGDRVSIGAYVVVMDSDVHVVGDRSAHAVPQPVEIGSDVVIGHRVTILRGSTIGDGAHVESGSVVAGAVPAGAVVAGVPAHRVLSENEEPAAGGPDLPRIVMQVLGLSELPKDTDGPDTIPQWDSLGTLKLFLALEQALGVTLAESALKSVRSLAELSRVVDAARAAPSHAA